PTRAGIREPHEGGERLARGDRAKIGLLQSRGDGWRAAGDPGRDRSREYNSGNEFPRLGYSEYHPTQAHSLPRPALSRLGDKFWGRELLVGHELSKKRGLLARGDDTSLTAAPQQKQPTDSATRPADFALRVRGRPRIRTEEGAEQRRAEIREALLPHVKREVKQLMRVLSVARNVEDCLLYGLKRQSLLTGENSTLALLHRVAKSCQRPSTCWDRLAGHAANGGQHWLRGSPAKVEQTARIRAPLRKPCENFTGFRFGPCALDYTKAKSMSCAFKERSTEELLQRHLRASPMRSPGSPKTNRAPSLRPARWDLSTTSSSSALAALSESSNSAAAAAAITASAADNLLLPATRSAGPLCCTAKMASCRRLWAIAWRPRTRLSVAALHSDRSCSEWMPNSVMLGGGSGGTPPPSPSSVAEGASPLSADAGIDDSISSPSDVESSLLSNRSRWRQDGRILQMVRSCSTGSINIQQFRQLEAAFLIRVEEMGVHSLPRRRRRGSLVFVARDGTQQPPLHFPRGRQQRVAAAITCAAVPEAGTGLARQRLAGPAALDASCGRRGRPDGTNRKRKSKEPVWGACQRLSVRSASRSASAAHSGDENGMMRRTMCVPHRAYASGGSRSSRPPPIRTWGLLSWPGSVSVLLCSLQCSQPKHNQEGARRDFLALRATKSPAPQPASSAQASISSCCSSMRRQILSRAFNGWLSQMRHARTRCAVPGGPAGWSPWGRQVWPLMLGFHPWDSTETERRSLDRRPRPSFENLLSEWGPVDVIVRENDKEQKLLKPLAAASAKSKVKKQQQNLRPQNREAAGPAPPPPPPFIVTKNRRGQFPLSPMTPRISWVPM
uniref:BHLH domain-containing protein n=1 Tax=Macrostomum lignano TaxID=282301 RepID=A0A1I8FDR7_9PLAT